MLYNIGIVLIVAVSALLLLDMYRSLVLRKGKWQKKKDEVEHDWEFRIKTHDRDNHKEYGLYRCKACDEYKRVYTSNVYQKKNEIPDHDCHNVPATGEGHCEVCSKYYSANKCEFCDSMETTKYPAEGRGDVYLCEDCHSVGQDDR